MAVSFWKRQTQGTAFLTLEHVGHMASVVVLAVLGAAAVNWLIVAWWGQGWPMGDLMRLWPILDLNAWLMWMPYNEVGLAAAILLFAFALWLLGARTRAEWGKRLGYTKRAAYKVPIYTAMGVLMLVKLSADVVMLAVLLTSLTWMGMANAPDQTAMYARQFLPALVLALVAGGTVWHLSKMAKGQTKGMEFSKVKAVVGVLLALALLITYASNIRQPGVDMTKDAGGAAGTMLEGSGDGSGSLDDLLKY